MKRQNTNNPWIGWSSYHEDSINNGHKFVGRTNEISELFSLIDNNLLVTIYGKSGIGKTSLLQAGVFPSLIAADYLPVICRYGSDKESGKNYIVGIIEEIRKKCKIVSDVDISSISNLVELFKHCSFKVDNKDVFPTLVFDQFEDWLRLGNGLAASLLEQISFLVSNDYQYITNFRFVLSIREDYLFLLEEMIDSIASSELKQNRYRLTRLTDEQAKDIFALGDMTEAVKDRLLEITKDGTGYSPGLISFFCHELYEVTNGNITDESLGILNNETVLIEEFYDKCFRISDAASSSEEVSISDSTKDYIENHFQENGLRTPQKVKQVKSVIPKNEFEKLLKGSNRLLQKFPAGGEEYVELIHDKIAEIIYKKQIQKIEDAQQRLENARKRLTLSILIVYFSMAGIFVWRRLCEITNILSEILGSEDDVAAILPIKLVVVILLIFFIVFIIPFNISSYIFNPKRLKYLIMSSAVAVILYISLLNLHDIISNLLKYIL